MHASVSSSPAELTYEVLTNECVSYCIGRLDGLGALPLCHSGTVILGYSFTQLLIYSIDEWLGKCADSRDSSGLDLDALGQLVYSAVMARIRTMQGQRRKAS